MNASGDLAKASVGLGMMGCGLILFVFFALLTLILCAGGLAVISTAGNQPAAVGNP